MKFQTEFVSETKPDRYDFSQVRPWAERSRLGGLMDNPYAEIKETTQSVLKQYWNLATTLKFKKTLNLVAENPASRLKFNRLLKAWKQGTAVESSLSAIVMHKSYQKIIGMGPSALPFILEQLKKGSPLWWYWALEVITEHNPVPLRLKGRVRKMAFCWIKYLENEYSRVI